MRTKHEKNKKNKIIDPIMKLKTKLKFNKKNQESKLKIKTSRVKPKTT